MNVSVWPGAPLWTGISCCKGQGRAYAAARRGNVGRGGGGLEGLGVGRGEDS